MKIYVDAGHGGNDPGAIGHGIKEKDITLSLAKIIQKQLSDYPTVQVKLSRQQDKTKSLHARTKEANDWKADLFLSLHCNAFNSKVSGYEDYIYSGLNENSKTSLYQRMIHENIIKRIHLTNRGRKKANFHVLRETKMPAILTENGFIDNINDAMKMKDTAWLYKVATGHVEGIAAIFDLKNVPTAQPKYAVIAGSFQTYENAARRVDYLFKHRIRAEIIPTLLQGKTIFRVQSGLFAKKAAAHRHAEQYKKINIPTFILKL